jgi:hypothetical protein
VREEENCATITSEEKIAEEKIMKIRVMTIAVNGLIVPWRKKELKTRVTFPQTISGDLLYQFCWIV